MKEDVFAILEGGYVEGHPHRNEHDEWQCIVVRRIVGTRDAAAVTVVCKAERLIVRTVMWKDEMS